MFISKVIFHFILFLSFFNLLCISLLKRETWHYPAHGFLPEFAPPPLPSPTDTKSHKVSLADNGIFTCSQGTELPVCSRVSGWLTSDTANDGNALTARLRSTPGQVRPCLLSCSNMRLLRPCRRNTDDREIQLYFDLIFENEHCLSLHKSALGLFEVAVSVSCKCSAMARL